MSQCNTNRIIDLPIGLVHTHSLFANHLLVDVIACISVKNNGDVFWRLVLLPAYMLWNTLMFIYLHENMPLPVFCALTSWYIWCVQCLLFTVPENWEPYTEAGYDYKDGDNNILAFSRICSSYVLQLMGGQRIHNWFKENRQKTQQCLLYSMNPSVPVVVHLRLDGMMSNGLQYKTTEWFSRKKYESCWKISRCDLFCQLRNSHK